MAPVAAPSIPEMWHLFPGLPRNEGHGLEHKRHCCGPAPSQRGPLTTWLREGSTRVSKDTLAPLPRQEEGKEPGQRN